MIVLNVLEPIIEFFEPVISFFKDIWNDIHSFLLQYMSQDVFNIFVFGILVAIALIIVLAIMNRN